LEMGDRRRVLLTQISHQESLNVSLMPSSVPGY
jgi:hypothetical protein